MTASNLTTIIFFNPIGNYAGGWILKRTSTKLLLGDQLLVQTILVPQDMERVPLKAKVTAVASGPFGLLPIRLKSDWENIESVLL